MNVYRSVLVEAMVASVLTDWNWCSADYAAFDFQHTSGLRLEVKQTSLTQTWTPRKPSKPFWDIKPRTGAWVDGATWTPGIGRNAEVYIFALHSIIDETADHRDGSQWQFFVIESERLPATQRLGIPAARALSEPVALELLHKKVESVLPDGTSMKSAKREDQE